MKLKLLVMCLALFPFSNSALADLTKDIIARGTLNVGVALFEPWTYKNAKGELVGHEIEIVEKLAADLGVKVKLQPYPWTDIVPALNKGEVDVIAAGMAITPKRAISVNFSQPYFSSGATMVAHTETTKHINGLAQINRKAIVVATVEGNYSQAVAKRLFPDATHRVFSVEKQAETAVMAGDVHVYITNFPAAQRLVKAHQGMLDLPLEKPLAESKAAFAIKKGDADWLNFLDSWVISHQADGWFKHLYQYWFNGSAWKAK